MVVHPIVWAYWEENKQSLIDTAPKKDVRLTGDGQYDSPGYNAGHLFYRFFFQHFSVVDPDPGSGAFLTPGSGIRDG